MTIRDKAAVPTPMRLLLIEDDELLGEGLRDFLSGEGHRVDWCRSLHEACLLYTSRCV